MTHTVYNCLLRRQYSSDPLRGGEDIQRIAWKLIFETDYARPPGMMESRQKMILDVYPHSPRRKRTWIVMPTISCDEDAQARINNESNRSVQQRYRRRRSDGNRGVNGSIHDVDEMDEWSVA